jgi:hypothetical protein
VGEIDLDFDSGECHLQPANSDVRSFDSDRHLDLLNETYSYFMAPLTLACQIRRFHCMDEYADARCP